MSDRESCTHHFEHVKQTRPFTEREYMECSKCGLQNPLGLFQHVDFDRDGPAVKWPPRDNGGKLLAGLTTVINRTGHGMTTDEYLEAEKQRQYGLKLAANYIRKKYGPKRKPIVKVQKTQTGWLWTCRICDHFFMSTKWSIIIKSANRHAHNHH